MKTSDEPAFPRAGSIPTGLTKREWFAGLALSGSVSADGNDNAPIKNHAEFAVLCADALIAELERTK